MREPVCHYIKVWPQFFDDIASGKKKAELRVNDRDYQEGDVLRESEWDPETGTVTGRTLDAKITHVLRIVDLDDRLKSSLGLNPCMAPVNTLAVLSIEVLPQEATA